MLDIRNYHPGDLLALCRICLRTGANGGDASALCRDPDLLGLTFVAPYVRFEPELCFVLTRDRQPCGYVLGTRDSAAFGECCEQDWFPLLRQRYPLPVAGDASLDAWVIRKIHAGWRASSTLADYPAHLHIDLLPEAQGRGWGRALIDAFVGALRVVGVAGVHARVSKENERAIGFYSRLGFLALEQTEKTVVMARQD